MYKIIPNIFPAILNFNSTHIDADLDLWCPRVVGEPGHDVATSWVIKRDLIPELDIGVFLTIQIKPSSIIEHNIWCIVYKLNSWNQHFNLCKSHRKLLGYPTFHYFDKSWKSIPWPTLPSVSVLHLRHGATWLPVPCECFAQGVLQLKINMFSTRLQYRFWQ